MADLRAHIRAREDPGNAERLCRDIVLNREALAQRLLEDGISHFWTDFGVMPSVQNHKADSQPTQNNLISDHISISDDSDEDGDAIISHDDHQEPADRDYVGEDANKEPENPTRAREKHAYTRQTHSPPSPRPKRRRRNSSEHLAGIYDLPSSPFEEDRDETGRRQIKIGDVEEQDFIFQFPEMGPGYFIVRCDRGKHIHHFQEDPLKPYRGQPIMVNHFKSKAPSSKCHKKDDAKTYSTIEIMKEFGYRVVDYDNSDVDSERVKASNEKLALKLDQNKSRHKGKEKMAAPPKYKPATSRKGVSPEYTATKPQLVESDILPSEEHGLAQEEQQQQQHRTRTASATLSPPGW
ncbi:hypothetical protein C7999DRAFT_29739 [Corynascus novoguineensis]|uniref:Uncharacterized protein n=1 Tax=Corynascus novoguineensis TaxID=1126955 RepID=A0AAN7CX42_9PEZI|nr:hypothetical protein C7999DRAFT_29739 [Corynascus novoguineensis]